MKNFKWITVLLLVLLAFLFLNFHAYASGAAASIEIDASPVSGGTSSTVTAAVYDESGNPVEGETVSFSTSFGMLDAASATLDADGKASTTITSDVSGSATVEASIGELSAFIEVQLANPAGDVAADKEWLTADEIRGNNTDGGWGPLQFITENLSLPTSGPHNSTISWQSSDTSIVTTSGEVYRDDLDSDTEVTLTARIEKDNTPAVNKTFSLTVKKLFPDEIASKVIGEDMTWLVNNFDQVLNENTDSDNITGDLFFPTSGPNGSKIEWSADYYWWMVSGGDVIRPTYTEGDKNLTLVADFSYGAILGGPTERFNITIKAKPQTDIEAVVETWNWLNYEKILNGNISDGIVTMNLNLPVSHTNGSEISWTTSHPDVIASNGEVTRPAYSQGDSQVTLTATISKASEQDTKTFDDVTVQAVYNTSQIILSADPVSGASTSTVTATLYDENDNPVEGDIVSFSTSFGVLDSDFVSSNADGKASVTLSSNTSGTAAVTASVGGILASMEVQLHNAAGDEAAANVAADKQWLTDEIILSDNPSLDFIVSDLYLPTSGPNGSDISWQSNPSDIYPIINLYPERGIVGTVERYYLEGDQQVTLTARISKENVPTEERTFNLTLKYPDTADIDDKSADYQWLTDEQILNDNTAPDNITGDLHLPQTGPNGSTIEWSSSEPDLVSKEGTVTRPVYTEGDRSAYLSATIYKGTSGFTYKGWSLTIKLVPPDNPEVIVNETCKWLTVDKILEGNISAGDVTESLNLPDSGPYGGTISWTSSQPEVIAEDGTVVRPIHDQGDAQVTLTANISEGEDFQESKTFVITVKAYTEQEVVALDKEWLTLDDILNDNKDSNNVTDKLSFPTSGSYGSSISWVSLNEEVIASDGTVTRPPYTVGNQTVDFHAYISEDPAWDYDYFTVTVLAEEPTDEEAVVEDYNWLTEEWVLNGNAADNVVGNLRMPIKGPFESKISWTSTNKDIVALDGTVIRPSFTEGDKQVTITAEVSKESAQAKTKTFELWVKASGPTDVELVTLGKAWLNVNETLGVNLSQFAVTSNLSLPVSTPNGAEISWSSDKPRVISNTGNVIRPKVGQDNEPVNLTAAIKSGKQQETKYFEYTVLALPDTDPPRIVKTTPERNSSGVSFDSQITITFNEEIQKGVSWNDIYLGLSHRNWYEYTPYTLTINNNRLIISPSSHMEFGKEYQLSIPLDAVTDKAGNPIEEGYGGYWKDKYYIPFSVEPQLEREIEVISSNPAPGAKQVSLEPSLSFNFNYADIEQGRAFNDISLYARDGAAVPVTPQLNGDTVTLELDTQNQLKPGVVYEMVIPEGAVQDRYRNESNPRTIPFITEGGNIMPEVTGTYPLDGQEGVAVNQSIEIIFSDEIDGWESSDIKLMDEDGNWYRYSPLWIRSTPQGNFSYYRYPYGFSYSLNDRSLTIKPDLEPETQYTLSIPFCDYSMTFTTGTNSLSIDKVDPADENSNGNAQAPINTPVEIEFLSPVSKVAEVENIVIKDSTGVTIAFDSDIAGNKVVLRPANELSPGETYFVDIPRGAFKDADNSLNDSRRFGFTTASKLDEDQSYSFAVQPSSNYFPNKPLTFTTEWLENLFKEAGREIVSCEWCFGDGRVGSGKTAEHTYSSLGDYSVILRMKDSKGISYEYEETVSITEIEASNATISFNQNYGRQSFFATDYANDNIKYYSIHLSVDGIPLPQEEIKVMLYHRDIWTENLGSIVTNSSGNADFRFNYNGLEGSYELVFTYGGEETESVKRLPVRVYELGDIQSLKLKFKTIDGENLDLDRLQVEVELNGKKKYGLLQADDSGNYYYSIPFMRLGEYNLKLSDNGFLGKNYNIVRCHIKGNQWRDPITRIYENGTTVYHWGGGYKELVLKRKQPGINYIKTDYSDTRYGEWYQESISEGSGRQLKFEVDGDDDGLGFWYYEIKAGTEIVKRVNTSSFKFKPGLQMKPGESLYIRMVTENGAVSDWVKANVRVLPLPSFGSGVTNKQANGENWVETSMTIDSLVGDNISILDDLPLLGNNRFGLGSSNSVFRGVMGREEVVFYLGDNYAIDLFEKEKVKTPLKSVGYDVSGTLSGKVVFKYNDNSREWDFSNGYITILGDGSYYQKRSYTIPVVDIGISPKLSIGSQLGGTLILDIDSNYSGIIHFAPYVKASLDVGTDDVSVEGYLAGIIPVDYHIPTKYLEVEPTISAGITAHFLCYSQTVFSKDLVKAHWDNGRTPVTFNALLSQPMLLELKTEESELKPMSRNYLKRESRWLAGGKPKERALMSIMTAVSADTSNPQVKIMKDNIYPYADAKLLCNGDELWLVWVEDNSERSDLNRTQLMYSAYKDGSWSAPQWIADDGTADFSPTAAAAENGVLMAWQNNKQALAEGASLGDTIENAEISVTQNVYTDVDSDPRVVTLTDDSKFDHAPKLAADGNNALLVWTKSEGLGFTLGEDTEQYRAPANSDRLVFSSWNGSIWSEPMEIANSLPTVIHSSLTMNGSEGLLLYTLDMDNDQSTQQDREVFARIYDGSAWEEEIRLTDNQVSDDSPKAVYSNGEWFMTWYQDGNIMYQVGLDGAAGTEEFLEKLPSNYEIAVKEGTKPQVALVYRQMGEDNARRLATSFYDMEKEVWSDEIVLTEEAGYIRSFSPVFTEDDRLTAAYTQAEIINEVIDGEEHPKTSSKVDLYTMTYTPQSDLTLDEEFGLQLSPEIPWPDSAAVSTVVIKNEGDYAENVTLHLYDGNPDAGGTKIGEATTKEPIPARSSAQVEISWVIDAEERDKYNFYAVVDPEDTIWENDESNNVINHEVVTADIAVTDLQCRNLAKDNYMVTAMVKNTGSRSLQEVKIELNNSQSTQPIDSKELDQLRPGQEVGLSFLVSSSGLRADANGKIQMMLTASLPEGVEEFSAENNTYEFELVSAQIVVTRMNPTPGESQVGIQQPLTLDFNMNVEQGTDFEQIRLEDDYLNAVDISKMLDGSTLTVTPQTALDHNTRYTLTIPGDAVGDDYGHKMEEAYQLSFVTTSSSPEIALAYPGSGLEDVSPDTDIKMQFNQHILEGPAIEGIKLSGPGSEEISTSVSIEGEWLYVYPMSSLEINSAYSLLVPAAAVKNDRGELLQEDYSAAFETGNERKEETDDGDDNQQFDYRITRETAADGSTRAVVSVSQDDLLNIQTVTIDVSEQVSEDEAVSVNFSPDAAKKLTNSRSNLMITTGKGDLLFPAGILASLAGDGGSSISITIAENNQQDTGSDSVSNGAFDFSISKGEEQVKEFTGEVLVIIPLDMSRVGNAKRVIVCVYDKATNSWKPVGGVADAADGSITFKTRHFSTYAAFETVKHFDDVTSDWAKEEVEVLASRRLINGKTENTFDPEGSITRAEFTALIVRSLYTDLLDRKGTFKDVPNDTWFSGAVETACAKGLINGTGDDKFQPNAEISREQLATIAYRFYQYKTGDESGMDNKNKLFKDNRDISSWAEEAVNFVSSNQIMIGSEDRFYPQRSTNRQEAAVVLYRLLEYIGEL